MAGSPGLDALRRPVARQAISAEVAQIVIDHLLTGHVKVGDALPSERELMEALNVGRSAVREALAALKLLGVVEAVPGGRYYLRGLTSQMLPKAITWGLLLGEKAPMDVFETRAALEVRAAYLVAGQCEPKTLARLKEIFARLSQGAIEPAQAIDDDLAFHETIIKACNNRVMFDLWQSVRSLLRVWIVRVNERERRGDSFVQLHGAVLEAIAQGDGDAAAKAMNRLMDDSSRALAVVLTEAAASPEASA
ncbi:MAG: FadR family transcriptional regulator [Bifidobacteriaceae bacterium]|jgi:GntR family transcriptional repressor for pyruvate dehydrogenase complex|nr:FadR family transcriptional regulator [Bifidobacteriaceae bacterium]